VLHQGCASSYGCLVLLLLASSGIGSLAGTVLAHDGGRPTVYVPTAADLLEDRDAIVAEGRRVAASLGTEVVELDIAGTGPGETGDALTRAGAVVVSGGDPFRLAVCGRSSGFAEALAGTVRRGVPYVGMSAGATAAARDLTPLVDVSPFDPVDIGQLRGWALTPTLVLPHRDHSDRVERIAGVLRRFGDRSLEPLADGQILVIDDARARVWSESERCWLRDARPGDAHGISITFAEAAGAAWSGFLDRHPTVEETLPGWEDRIASIGGPARLVVAETEGEIVGFVWAQPATGDDAAPGRGELSAFYTRPSLWGAGFGRLLMQQALDALHRAGFDEAVLWTESRNHRPLRLYRRLGWEPDGTVREREYLGTRLREIRLRRSL
jgi:peptidase E/L-amino acid N-acyltransferase YncA